MAELMLPAKQSFTATDQDERIRLAIPSFTRVSESDAISYRRLLPSTWLEADRGVSLWKVLEDAASLLTGAAGGWPVEVHYGEAAAVHIGVSADTIEKTLLHLVSDAAAALELRRVAGTFSERREDEQRVAHPGRRLNDRSAGPVSDFAAPPPGVIRVVAGGLNHRLGRARPWPFRRVQLIVEDSGRRLPAEYFASYEEAASKDAWNELRPGLQEARSVVAATGGDLQVESNLLTGTCVQVSWPVPAESLQVPSRLHNSLMQVSRTSRSGDGTGRLPSGSSDRSFPGK